MKSPLKANEAQLHVGLSITLKAKEDFRTPNASRRHKNRSVEKATPNASRRHKNRSVEKATSNASRWWNRWL